MTHKIRILAATALTTVGAVLAASGPAPVALAHSVPELGAIEGTVVIAPAKSQQALLPGTIVAVSWIPGLENSTVGNILSVETLDVSPVDRNGAFRLSIPQSSQLTHSRNSNDGWLNFTAGVIMPNGYSRTMDFSWNPESNLTTSSLDLYRRSILTIPIEASAENSLISKSLVSEANDGSYSAYPEQMGVQGSALGCQFVVDSDFTRNTAIVNGHSDTNSKIRVTYGATANSDIDTGLKHFNSGWALNGSVHIGNTQGSESHTTVTGKFNGYFKATFAYRKGHFEDYFGAPNGTLCKGLGYKVGDHKVTAGNWQGGGITTGTGAGSGAESCLTPPRASYKTELPNGGYTSITSSSQTKITTAVTTPYLTLGAKSGFSTKVKQEWWGTAGNGVWICGQNGPLSGTPGIVYLQNK